MSGSDPKPKNEVLITFYDGVVLPLSSLPNLRNSISFGDFLHGDFKEYFIDVNADPPTVRGIVHSPDPLFDGLSSPPVSLDPKKPFIIRNIIRTANGDYQIFQTKLSLG